MKSLDIRSEPAIKLLAEFLDMDSDTPKANAEHFAHGVLDLYWPMRILTCLCRIVLLPSLSV